MDTFGLQGKNLFWMEMYESITHFPLKNRFQNCWRIGKSDGTKDQNFYTLIELFPKYPKLGTSVQSQDENNKHEKRGSN